MSCFVLQGVKGNQRFWSEYINPQVDRDLQMFGCLIWFEVMRPNQYLMSCRANRLTYSHFFPSTRLTSACAFANNYQLPYLNLWKGENSHRNGFMINLHASYVAELWFERDTPSPPSPPPPDPLPAPCPWICSQTCYRLRYGAWIRFKSRYNSSQPHSSRIHNNNNKNAHKNKYNFYN